MRSLIKGGLLFIQQGGFMRTSKSFLIGLLAVLFVCGTVGLVLPPPSHADVQFGGIKKILKKIFPPCGPGTRHQRFKVSKDGNSVCDNKTGLYWEQSPSMTDFVWGPAQGPNNAIDHCANLTLSGKTWRLAEVKEYISLVDYSVPDQAANLNAPTGPFQNVQPANYWSASELAGDSASAWLVGFVSGFVFNNNKVDGGHAWCVSGGQDAH